MHTHTEASQSFQNISRHQSYPVSDSHTNREAQIHPYNLHRLCTRNCDTPPVAPSCSKDPRRTHLLHAVRCLEEGGSSSPALESHLGCQSAEGTHLCDHSGGTAGSSEPLCAPFDSLHTPLSPSQSGFLYPFSPGIPPADSQMSHSIKRHRLLLQLSVSIPIPGRYLSSPCPRLCKGWAAHGPCSRAPPSQSSICSWHCGYTPSSLPQMDSSAAACPGDCPASSCKMRGLKKAAESLLPRAGTDRTWGSGLTVTEGSLR